MRNIKKVKKSSSLYIEYALLLLIGAAIGISVSYVLPVPASQTSTLEPAVINVAEEFQKDFDQQRGGFEFTEVLHAQSGSIEFFKIENEVKLHKHPKENHILYVLGGKAEGMIGDVKAEVGPGQLVVIPADVPHKVKTISNGPFEFILFSTPAFDQDDIVWLEE
ncbi:MAG: cupin domain-containing protein [Candidatus Aenigmarchaeota archaeon]|nr:cupin domain-containing protein [Candidatus Aenigmarchaeota archaeon]